MLVVLVLVFVLVLLPDIRKPKIEFAHWPKMVGGEDFGHAAADAAAASAAIKNQRSSSSIFVSKMIWFEDCFEICLRGPSLYLAFG